MDWARTRAMGLGFADAQRATLVWFGPVGPLGGTFTAYAFLCETVNGDRSEIPAVVEVDGVPVVRPFFPFKIREGQSIRIGVEWKHAGGRACGALMGEWAP